MPTEEELSEKLKHSGSSDHGIDVGRVIRRSRRRRLSSRLAIGSAVTLAVVGLSIVAINGVGTGMTLSAGSSNESSTADRESSTGQDSNGASAPARESGAPGTVPSGGATDSVGQAPANKTNLCEGTLAEVAQTTTGLELTAAFPTTAPTGTGAIEGTVVMTNVGDSRVVGTTAALPAMTLSQDSTVLWHSNGFSTMIAVPVDLAPGESMDYPASFEPVRCAVQDDTEASFRAGLPPVAPGTYLISAAIDFVPDPSAAPVTRVVTGPVSSIVLK